MKKNKNNKIEMPKLKDIYNTIVNTSLINVKKIKKELKKELKKAKKHKYILITMVIIVISLCCVFFFYIALPPKIINIEYSNKVNEDNTQVINVKFKLNNKFKTKCKLNNGNWIESKNNMCTFDVSTGINRIYIKNLYNKKELSELVNVKGVKKVELESEKYYLALNESIKLNAIIDAVGDADTTLTWITSNPDIVSVDNGTITGLSTGEAYVTVASKNNNSFTSKVIVTDLITPMVLNDRKSVLTCNKYTEEEAAMLDDILKSRVELKGEYTRAALIEVIRFITLSFKDKIPYFFENGRLEPYGTMNYVDGEGRYYHKGLYLSESKKNDIVSSFVGPSIWGCPLTNFDDLYGWTIGAKYPNGLDCSGFVSWAFYNAGIDVGDIGAGISNGVDDLSDYGEMHKLTYELINNKEFKVGDIIGWDGHIALIAGVDDEYIYIAESLSKGVRIATYNYKNKYSELYRSYTFVNNLDSLYKGDGEYTDMWY